MRELTDMHLEARRLEVFEIGIAVNAGMSDKPKEALNRILFPPKEISIAEVHPMLRPGAKKETANA